MLAAQRREEIRSALQQKGWLSVTELAQIVGASLSTIRRDLIELEQAGVLVRTRGGTCLAGRLPEEMSEHVRAQKHAVEKKKIGQAAARLVDNAGSIILDAGTTTLEVARALNPVQPLRVITDSVEIAYELRDKENIVVIVTGGIMRPHAYNLFGGMGEQMLAGMHAQICVMGGSALSLEEGLTKHDIESMPIRRKMVEISRQLIAVVDSSKFSKTGLASVCPVTRINVLVTDSGIDSAFRSAIEKAGVQVIVAE
ncbi:MAG: hypothetical protein PWR31_1241 [Bacillota bacterium]|nr:hypothetical protein [Bacillota bacterium]